MPELRISACRDGEIGNQSAPWTIFGETAPGDLEDNARNGAVLDRLVRQSGSTPFASPEGQPAFNPDGKLGQHIAALPDTRLGDPNAPVIVFVHGFQFEARRPLMPRMDSDNPHRRLWHYDEAARAGMAAGVDDPVEAQRLEDDSHVTPFLARAFFPDGHGRAEDNRGLAVCFGYSSYGDTSDEGGGFLDMIGSVFDFSTPTGRPQNFHALAYMDAGIAGHALAAVLFQLSRRLEVAGRAGQPIHLIGHSLGTRTIMKALDVLAWRYPGEDKVIEQIDKVLLLAGACLWEQAGIALKRVHPADPEKVPQFFNVSSPADGVVRALGSRAALRLARAEAGIVATVGDQLAAFALGTGSLGREGRPPKKFYQGTQGVYANWVDIDLNSAAVQAWGRSQELELAGDLGMSRKDHWIHYTRPGNWALYRRILRGGTGWTARELKKTVPGQRG